jgi:hypothetical protein
MPAEWQKPWMGVDYSAGPDRVVWRCSECAEVASTSDDLLRHIWRAHARDIVLANPSYVEALWLQAAKQQQLRREVLR